MNHRWDYDCETRTAAHDAADGNGRTEKTCLRCSIVKITVHPPRGFPWHEWRMPNGKIWNGEATPPCRGEVVSR